MLVRLIPLYGTYEPKRPLSARCVKLKSPSVRLLLAHCAYVAHDQVIRTTPNPLLPPCHHAITMT